MATRTAVFAGTFDPVSHGHVDVIRRAARLFDRLVVLVSAAGKSTLLPVEERVALVRSALSSVREASVEPFDGLLAEHARRLGAVALVRGVRTFQDWEYELRMVQMNRHLAPEIETVFLAPSPEHAFVSSSLIREVAALGADLSSLVPPPVADALRRRFPPRPR
jgi:pantetheine-phosphate adenylyltransferase